MTTTALPGGREQPGRARGRERLVAVLSLLALLALLVGLPALLATLVGWPLPHRVPTGTDLLDTARSPLTDRMVVNALACVFWLAWLQIVLCTAVEARAAVTGVGVPRALPLSGVTQHLTRRLVSSVLLLATATAVLTPVTAAATRALLPDGGAQPATSASAPASPAAEATVTPAAQPVQDPAAVGVAPVSAEDRTGLAGGLVGRKVLVVEPPEGRHHMSLWEIAETHLGDGLRYREVFALNEGREQPDGRTLVKARLIQPGWQLLMPDDAVDVPVVPAPALEAPAGVPAPAAGAADLAADQATGDVGGPAATAGATAVGAAERAAAPAAAADESPLVSALAVAEAGLLAAGVLGGLGRLRRVQQRRRAEGERLPVPPAELLRAEVAMRLGEDPETAAVLDDALRLLSARQGATGAALPDVVAAVVDRDALRLVLAAPSRPVPAPFTAADPAGGSWQAPRDALRGERPAVLSPYPALVSVGRDDQGAQLLVDLEAVGVLALSGPRRRTTAVLRALALELATSGWADHLRLTLVGFGQELTRLQPDRVRHVATLEEALPALEARAAALATRQDRTEDVLRSRVGDGDPVLPEIVLLAEQDAPDAAQLQRLRALADGLGGRRGLALVTSEDVPRARWSLRTDADGSAVVQPLGAGLTSRGVDDDAWEAVVRLVDLACSPTVPATATDAPADGPDLSPDGAPAAPARLPALAEVVAAGTGSGGPAGRLQLVPAGGRPEGPARAPAAQVRVLGPVEVDVAGAGPAPHPHCVELVALLALHPRGLDLVAVAAALQPRDDPAEAQRTTQVLLARTRSWLGVDEHGQDRLPRAAAGGPLRLGPAMALDADLFRAAVARGPLDDAHLALVRGRPLTGLPPRRGAWLAATGLEQELPAVVADATVAEARRRLAAGDAAGAREAAQAALRADVLDERAWRELLRAEAALGDLDRVAALADQLTALVERELSPYDGVQPETEALLAELLPRLPERAAR